MLRRVWYTDHVGRLDGTLCLEPARFVLEVGGVRFEGRSPDVLAPTSHTHWATPARFAFNAYDGVTDCRLEWEQPIKLLERVASAQAIHTSLWVQTQLQGDDVRYMFGLELGDTLLTTQGEEWEEVVYALTRAAGGLLLECCTLCDRCDFPAIGGAQAPVCGGCCFLGHEEALREVRHDRGGLYRLIARANPPWVSELHVCPSFMRRPVA